MPLVRPVILAEVAGGLPETVVGGWAALRVVLDYVYAEPDAREEAFDEPAPASQD